MPGPDGLEEARRFAAQGKWDDALVALGSLPEHTRTGAEARFLEGACHHALGRLTDARAAFEATWTLAPSEHCGQALIAVLCQQGRPEEALARFSVLAEMSPHNPQVRFNLGLAHEMRGALPEALARYEEALTIDPAFRPALLNRAAALTRLGRLEEALANNLAAAARFPNAPDSHFNLAEACLALARYSDAMNHCDRAIALDPGHLGAWFDKGLALAALGHIDAADRAFERARAIDPAGVRAIEARGGRSPLEPREVYLVRGFEALNACDWSDRAGYVRRFAQWIDEQEDRPLTELALAFDSIAIGLDPVRQKRLASALSTRVAQGIRKLPEASGGRASHGQRIRLGYVSSDFREHPVAYLTEGLFARHDRSQFDVFGYALTADDGGGVRVRIAASFDTFRDLSRDSDEAAARRIQADELDVIVDLSGYQRDARPGVVAMRPAPVQAAYLGYPGTLGAPWIDYLIADRTVAPQGSEANFTEQLVRLPTTQWCYGCPHVDRTAVPSRRAVGLPEDAPVLCAFHNGYKITPELFAWWAEVLRRAPRSVLWLLARTDAVRSNLLREARRAGISERRLVFAEPLPRDAHLARHVHADIFLDAHHYSAATTCLDALWVGVPVIAFPAEGFAARQSASALHALGLHDLVASSPERYVETAARLATDPAALDAIRKRLAAAAAEAPLFDQAVRARELEAGFRRMANRARAGLPPESFEIPPGAVP